MKPSLWLPLALLIICSAATFAQTTLEEYNYVTKGYKIQLEGGLDMKKGYRFENLPEYNTKSLIFGVMRNITFKALLRDGETKPCALLCVLSISGEEQSNYICIPHFASSQQIWDLANQELNSYAGDDAKTLMFGLAGLASYYGSK